MSVQRAATLDLRIDARRAIAPAASANARPERADVHRSDHCGDVRGVDDHPASLGRGNGGFSMGILSWLIVGAIAGWLAGLLVKGDEGMGVIMHIVLGIVGALVG